MAVNKQVATFLSVLGATVYSTLRDLFAPDPVKDKTLNETFDCLKSHFEPKRTTIVERYHFHKRDQAARETIADYEAALRNLAKYCEFNTIWNKPSGTVLCVVYAMKQSKDDCSPKRH